MLKKLRIFLAAVFFIGITLLFVGIGHDWWGWMAKLQFLPAVYRVIGGALGLNLVVAGGILLLTLLLGRIYCSVICPLGVYQDIVIWLRRRFTRKRFNYSKAVGATFVRYILLALLIASVFLFGQFAISLLAPYSAYGRMVQAVASLCGGTPVTMLLITAGATFVIVTICAWNWGRAWCNTICPVGSVLGIFGKIALFRPMIDESKCVGCGKCAHNCKASCIDPEKHKIDGSRCIDCFECLESCNKKAIRYQLALGHKDDEMTYKPDSGRRAFMATGAVLATGLAAKAQNLPHRDGGFAEVIDKQEPERSERLVPFGAQSVEHFYEKCTACQLCVSACPNHVLRPSTDLEHFLQPKMGFENGFCRPECTECGQVCPAGAILPISREEKYGIKIGTAVVSDECDGCGNCERHCPTGAVRIITDYSTGKKKAVVNEELCVGCGSCEFLCHVRPISAITVNGIPTHRSK